MLAAEDPYNPPGLLPLSRLSIKHYPAFLRRIEELSGVAVPFQTNTTVQYLEDGSTVHLAEHSIDPRQLATSLLAAVHATPIRLMEQTRITTVDNSSHGTEVHLEGRPAIATRAVLYAAGAWTAETMTALHGDKIPVAPRKGQMLRVQLPATSALHEVYRSERVYIVPRMHGPQAGTALIGATVEDAGFDTTRHSRDLMALRSLAAELLPELAREKEAPPVESWAGLRPATPDALPVLGTCTRSGHYVASGHYRNGILLAPATALVMADLIEGRTHHLDISAFSPERFRAH
jgi:glycine oxidase